MLIYLFKFLEISGPIQVSGDFRAYCVFASRRIKSNCVSECLSLGLTFLSKFFQPPTYWPTKPKTKGKSAAKNCVFKKHILQVG